jgi:hypothetical protein
MKSFTICFALMLAMTSLLHAQYSGGTGRGDISIEIPDIPLTDKGPVKNPLPDFSLHQNYPNPFNHLTSIRFNVSKSVNVKLLVYNVSGREVKTLLNEPLKPGTHIVSFDGSSLERGVYFCKISAGNYSETIRMILEN